MAHCFRGLRPSACKRPLAALLCCLLLAGTPVSAAEAPEISESGSASVLEDLLQQDLPPLAAEEGVQPGERRRIPFPLTAALRRNQRIRMAAIRKKIQKGIQTFRRSRRLPLIQ